MTLTKENSWQVRAVEEHLSDDSDVAAIKVFYVSGWPVFLHEGPGYIELEDTASHRLREGRA